MKYRTSLQWSKVEMLMQLQFVKGQCSFLVVFLVSKDCVQLKSTMSEKTNGLKLLQWRIKDTTWAHAQLLMNASMLLEASLEALNKKSMTLLKCMKSTRISGKFSLWEWKTLSGHAVLSPFQILRSCWLAVKIPTVMEKSICSMWTQRTGSLCITWTNWE